MKERRRKILFMSGKVEHEKTIRGDQKRWTGGSRRGTSETTLILHKKGKVRKGKSMQVRNVKRKAKGSTSDEEPSLPKDDRLMLGPLERPREGTPQVDHTGSIE